MALWNDWRGAASALYGAARARFRPPTSAAARTESIAIPEPWSDRDTTVFGANVTPETLAETIVRRNDGYLRQWVDLADHARRTHPHLHSQLSIREQSVVETEFEVLPGVGTNRKAARYAADACRELFAEWQRRGWPTWVAEIVGSIYYPASAHEVTWVRDRGRVVPVHLTRIAERRLSYACDRAERDAWQLRIYDEGDPYSPFNGLYGMPLAAFHPDKFLIHEARVAGQHRAAEGLFAIVGWFWLFGLLSWRDLMRLLAFTGRPPVIGYYAAGGAKAASPGGAASGVVKLDGRREATIDEQEAARRVVEAMGASMRAVLPDTVRLEALKFDTPTQPLQILTSREVNDLISKAVNGATGASDIVAGARAAHEVGERTTETFWRSDCRRTAMVGTELFTRFVRANPDAFRGAPTPILRAIVEPPTDRKAIAEGIRAAREAGARVPARWASELMQIPEPEDDEAVLEPLDTSPGPTAPRDPAADPQKDNER